MALFRKICKIYLVQQVVPKKFPEVFLNNMLFPWLVTRNDRYALVIEIRVDKKEVRLSGSYNTIIYLNNVMISINIFKIIFVRFELIISIMAQH
jgi:hypothetical protein